MARLDVDFRGFDNLLHKIDALQGDVKDIAKKALQEVHGDVTPRVHKDMEKHHRTGETEDTIEDTATIRWNGRVAYVRVGFHIERKEPRKGLPSVYLMYGTPKMDPDKKLYNEFFGAAARRRIREIEEDVLYEELRRLELM